MIAGFSATPGGEAAPLNLSLTVSACAVLGAFVKAKKPVLGICKGKAAHHIYFGGDIFSTSCAETQNTQKRTGFTKPEAVKGSYLEALYGETLCGDSATIRGGCSGRGITYVQSAKDGRIRGSGP